MNYSECNIHRGVHNLPNTESTKTISRIIGSIFLSLALTACNPTKTEPVQELLSESVNRVYPGTLSINTSDSPELKKAKGEFNLRITELKENYAVVAKIYEPKDIPKYAQCNVEGLSITEYIDLDDASIIQGLVEYLSEIISGLALYNSDITQELNNIYFVGDMYVTRKDPSLGYAELTYPDGVASGSTIILKYASGKYSKGDFSEIFHHELVHIIHSYPWPFPRSGVHDYGSSHATRGFARAYGMTNGDEDAATIGEAIMPLVLSYERSKRDKIDTRKNNDTNNNLSNGLISYSGRTAAHLGASLDEDNIFSRMRSDPILARKVMYMTGSYYDEATGRFIWDFTPVEFRHFFHVPKGQEVPFYAQMKKKGHYDYVYWNSVMNHAR